MGSPCLAADNCSLRRLSADGGATTRAIGRLHGPEGGFAGIESIFLLPAFGICVAGLVVGFMVRPRKEAWRLSSVLPAVLLWVGIAILAGNQKCTRFEIELTDSRGETLANTPVEFHLHEGVWK